MQTFLQKIGAIVVGVAMTIGGWFGYHQPDIKIIEVPQVQQQEQLGSDAQKFIGGTTYYLSGSGINSSATSLTLTSLTLPQNSYKIQDSDLADTFYLTLEPGNTNRQEFASCTTVVQNAAGTASLSGCTRGLSPISPYTASTTLQFSHSGGTSVIFSNPPQLYDQAAFKGNDESISGLWAFSQNPTSSAGNATSSTQLTTKAYVDGIANQGAATSTETNGGIVRLGTQAQHASSFNGGTSDPAVLQTKYATSTPMSGISGNYIVATDTNGKINANFIATTSNYTWTGQHNFNGGATTTNATTTTLYVSSGNIGANGLYYDMPTTITASSTSLMTDANGNLIWNFTSPYALLVDNTTRSSVGTASTTYTYTLPANTLGAGNQLKIESFGTCDTGTGANKYWEIKFGNGSATTTLNESSPTAAGIRCDGIPQVRMETTITPTNNSTSAQTSYSRTSNSYWTQGTPETAYNYLNSAKISSYDTTTQLYIAFTTKALADTASWQGITITKY